MDSQITEERIDRQFDFTPLLIRVGDVAIGCAGKGISGPKNVGPGGRGASFDTLIMVGRSFRLSVANASYESDGSLGPQPLRHGVAVRSRIAGGALAVRDWCAWCARGARGAFAVRSRCAGGALAVRSWFPRGALAVRVVRSRCACGAIAVRSRSSNRADPHSLLRARGALVVRLVRGPPSVVMGK